VPAPPALSSRNRGHVVTALARPDFRMLLTSRLVAQLGDGVFQASLAGSVLFDPDRAAHASDIAAGFAVLLLPYSIVGPFAGVLLDRWWRQRILVNANLLRALAVVLVAAEIAGGLHGLPFYASALVVLSITRFYLAALSAGLPHAVGADELVTANSISTTLGTLATTAGGGIAVGVQSIIGKGPGAYASVAVAAIVPYLVSAWRARWFGLAQLGPDDTERANRETVREIARGLDAGMRHLRTRRPAFYALAAIGVQRICYGLWAVSTVLLFRNYFHSDGLLRSGLGGLAQFAVVIAVGGGLAALVTPPVVRRLGYVRWPVLLFALAGAAELVCGLPFRLGLQLLGSLLIGFAAQGVKVCVDTLVQRNVDDEFRGRIFAFYDTLFNLAVVVAAVVTAAVLPENGRAPAGVVVVGVLYLLTAVGYLFTAGAVDEPEPGPVTAVPSTTV